MAPHLPTHIIIHLSERKVHFFLDFYGICFIFGFNDENEWKNFLCPSFALLETLQVPLDIWRRFVV